MCLFERVFSKKMPNFAPTIDFYVMLTKTTAIVLHNIKYGDSKMIVDMFTRAHGRMSFVVSIPKSSKSKLRKQFFQPLSMLSLEYDYRPKVQLQKIRNVALFHPYSFLQLLIQVPLLLEFDFYYLHML